MALWKRARIVVVNTFYFGFLSLLIGVIVRVAYQGNLLGGLVWMLFFPVVTGVCHEMHGCDNGVLCHISKWCGWFNFFCHK